MKDSSESDKKYRPLNPRTIVKSDLMGQKWREIRTSIFENGEYFMFYPNYYTRFLGDASKHHQGNWTFERDSDDEALVKIFLDQREYRLFDFDGDHLILDSADDKERIWVKRIELF